MKDYDLVGMDGLPPEIWAEQQALKRKQAIAQALLGQSQQPLEAPVVKGRFQGAISPFQGMAKVAQAYAAQKQLDEGDKAFAGLGGRYRQGVADALAKYQAGKAGTPASSESIVDEQANGGEGAPATINAPAVAGNPRRAIMEAMVSQYPQVRQLAGLDFAQMSKPPVKTDLGDRWKVEYPDGRVSYEQKAATPDAVVRQAGENARFAGVSGNTAATVAGANARHASVSGNTAATIAGENARHRNASGSAKLAAETTRYTHDNASGSAKLASETTRRGQDQAVDPVIQGRLAEWKAAGAERGKTAAEAQAALPSAIATAKQGVDLINQMIGDLQVDEKGKLVGGVVKPHPGFSVGVGASAQPGFQYIPGTDKAGFYALKDQVMGGAFLEAFKTLKGGGAITVIEGDKATSAITRMSTAQNEAEFVRAAREFQDVIRSGAERAARRAAGTPPAGQPKVVDW